MESVMWERVVQIDCKINKLLEIQKRIEEKIDHQKALDTQFSGLGPCLLGRAVDREIMPR